MTIRSLFAKAIGQGDRSVRAELRTIKSLVLHLLESRDRKEAGRAVYLGDHTALCRTAFGRKLYIDTRDMSLAPHLALDGVWEMWITEAMSRRLKPGMTCVDLGANFGWYSVLMADLIGPTGRLIAADANERMVALWRKSMDVNRFDDRTEIRCAAITDRIGEATFNALDKHMGSASLKDIGDAATQSRDTATPTTVPTLTLDALTAGRPVDILKIDCEGAEPAIVRAGPKTLQSPALQIFLEYAPDFYAPGEAAEMVGTLIAAGFSFFMIDAKSRVEAIGRDAVLNLRGLHNLYLKRA